MSSVSGPGAEDLGPSRSDAVSLCRLSSNPRSPDDAVFVIPANAGIHRALCDEIKMDPGSTAGRPVLSLSKGGDDGITTLRDLRGGPRPALGPGKGFTLLEVLVALFLLSIALVALIRAAGLEARALAHERDATLAQWVASNALAEVRLREQLPTGREEGREELGGRRWRWRLELTATDSPKIVRADVSVFPDEESDVAADAASARLQGFIER